MPTSRTLAPAGELQLAAVRVCQLRQAARAALLAAALALAGCGDSPQQLAAKAQDSLQRGDWVAAEIHTREWLKAEAESPAGRLMLAKVLLASGDLANAQTEARRAGELGQDDEDLLPLQAEILLAEQKFAAVTEQFKGVTLKSAPAQAALQLSLARAAWAQGDADTAQAWLAKSQAAEPGLLGALELKVRLLGAQGRMPEALAGAEDLVKRHPNQATAWALLGDLKALAPQSAPQAAEAYNKALTLRPQLLTAHAGLVQLAQRAGDKAAVKAQVAAMAKAIPKEPTTLLFQAQEAAAERQWVLARERLQSIAYRAGAPAEVLFLAGLVEMQLRNSAQADSFFNKALGAAPEAAAPRRALAALRLQAGQLDAAKAQLKAVLDKDSKDHQAWTLLGEVHARAGDFKAADAAFAKATKLRPADAAVQFSLARTRLASGSAEDGLRLMEAAAQADKSSLERDIELVTALVRRGQLPSAMKAVDRMAAKQPQAPVTDLLRGRILQLQGQGAAAREAFSKALEKEPGYLEAVSSLAQLDLDAKDLDAAKKRYLGFLKQNPKSAHAMLAIATLTRRAGGSRADAMEWLNKAVAASPSDALVWHRAIEFQQADGDLPGALSRALAAAQAVPNDSGVLRQLAQLQAQAGETAQVRSTLNRVAQLEPSSAEAAILLGMAHLSEGHADAARTQVERAATLAPNTPPVLRAQMALALLGDKDPAKARALALKEQKRNPKDGLGWQLLADVEVGQQRWPEAMAALETALGKSPATAVARQLHALQLAHGRAEAAAKLQDSWLAAQPADAEFMGHLAEMAMGRQDLAGASTWLERAVKLRPADALLLNNLAAVQLELKLPAALQTAQRAAQLAPAAPAVLDTLAQAYGAAADWEKAIEKQSAAVDLAPRAADLRLRLAQFYLKADKRGKAREELQKLLKEGTPAADRAAAERLLAQLNS